MAIKKGQQLELKITDIAYGGRGLAKVDGLAVFVDQAVPLDHVIARVIKKKKSYGEARVAEILEPSPDRITPSCKYSGFCGGCKWQFLKYEQQLIYKRRHVVDSLEHVALVKGVPVHPVISSPSTFGYRNKMEFSCSDKRWLLPDEMDQENVDRTFAIGLHVPGTFHKVLDTEACLLQPALGNQILNDVRTFIKTSDMPVYGLRSHIGFWRFLVLRHSATYDQWMVNIVTAAEDRPKVQPLADLLMAKYPEIVSVINNITARRAGVAIGEYEIILAGTSSLTDKIGPFEFEISSNSFFQTNTRGAEGLYAAVKDYAGLKGKETVVDLYSGTGTIAIYLSDSAREVIGMEINASAIRDAEKNCHRNRVPNCRFIHGDIKDCLSRFTLKPDVMIIDPPRAGMHKDVVKQVLNISPDRIIYVSCNPATLARDVGLMNACYRVLEVQPVDMFPHTYHIEAVAKLELKQAKTIPVSKIYK
ncbi:23S rRNA (uracil(1939)-C(5))-methyltransferase RlmD [Desulfobacteraceae bacterium SEEP-SAG9]|nr:23S rRNA (uracil(1939)-C(5))-methyltransferase RlmD [Desulfobacteraceae bacterium SEEP-SAG9]